VHELFRGMPGLIFLAMVGIPLVMAAAAIALGWYSRQAALRRRVSPAAPRGPAEDALGAGVTVAVVPLAFALLMLWARFG
jgi:hypothetical protein